MNNRGVSDVVATVIIIALTIVAISVVWLGVLPLIKDKVGSSDICNSVDVSIETAQGYTCWASDKNVTLVQVKKGANEINVSKIRFVVSSKGNSISYTNNTLLSKNSFAMYYLNTTGFSNVEKVEVVPYVKSGNAEKSCSSVFINKLSECGTTVLTNNEIAQVVNSGGVINRDGSVLVVNDVFFPQFSSYMDNNGTLVNSGLGLFNVSVANTNGTVLLEINGINITATNLSFDVYNVSYPLASSGTYSYKWYSFGNGSLQNHNSSVARDYVVDVCTDECICGASPAIGIDCIGGSKYAGAYSGYRYMTTQSDGGYMKWSTVKILTGAQDLSGKVNTDNLAARGVAYVAATYCQNLVYGGYSDWFLPSVQELENVLYNNRITLGGFEPSFYWSSTEATSSNSWSILFSTGGQYMDQKTFSNYVRCVRMYL